ncbi:MAG: DNA-processing protein DprA [Clostridia bacterium]|nr:DNA-processing protein DprA [Clostridia bacterium]
MTPDTDLLYLLWMTEVACIAPQKGVRLLEAFGSAKAVWEASSARIANTVKLEDSERKRLDNRSLAKPNLILARCKLQNIALLPVYDEAYPQRLRNIYDPPLILYVRGRLPDFNRLPAVAVVGQRKATPYGTIVTERLAFQLSCSGVIVVSGMAAGIDSAAHNGAVKGDTPTVAVFGTAIDQCYPASNAGLLRAILHSGAAVSEYPPGKKTNAGAFPRRNRIISGLCLGVVVGEAPAKSGSLITAGLALDQGRDVFAVPGAVNAPASEGCNELIARGAKLVRDARDVLEEYVGLYRFKTADEAEEIPEKPAAVKQKAPTLKTVYETPEEPRETPAEAPADPVLAALTDICSLEELGRRCGMDTTALLGRLTLLELQGKVRQLPGQVYEKV